MRFKLGITCLLSCTLVVWFETFWNLISVQLLKEPQVHTDTVSLKTILTSPIILPFSHPQGCCHGKLWGQDPGVCHGVQTAKPTQHDTSVCVCVCVNVHTQKLLYAAVRQLCLCTHSYTQRNPPSKPGSHCLDRDGETASWMSTNWNTKRDVLYGGVRVYV